MTWIWLDIALWVLFVVVWVGSSGLSRPTVRSESLGSGLRHRLLLVAAWVLLFAQRLGVPWLDARWIPAAWWTGALSVTLTALGIGFAVWARWTLGRNWSSTVTVKEGHELIQTGPYALARHPIYTGMLTGFLGTALGMGTVRAALGVLLMAAAWVVKLRTEERFMRDQFGEAYEAYRRRVRALLPYLW